MYDDDRPDHVKEAIKRQEELIEAQLKIQKKLEKDCKACGKYRTLILLLAICWSFLIIFYIIGI